MITVQYDQFYGATTANNKIHGAKARTGQSFVQCSLSPWTQYWGCIFRYQSGLLQSCSVHSAVFQCQNLFDEFSWQRWRHFLLPEMWNTVKRICNFSKFVILSHIVDNVDSHWENICINKVSVPDKSSQIIIIYMQYDLQTVCDFYS